MNGEATTHADLSSGARVLTAAHAILLCEVCGQEATLLSQTPAAASVVRVRHMLSACPVHPLQGSGDAPGRLESGVTLIEDLRASPGPSMVPPFHGVDVIIPWVVLDRIADQVGAAPLEGLEVDGRAGHPDPTIAHLVGALLPTLRTEGQMLQHYVDQLGLALASHIAHAYGRLSPRERRQRGGLAPHLLRRAQAMLRADLSTPPSLEALAQACGLSARHFARAFRDSTGLTPHRWTMRARVAAAQALMQSGPDRLAEIASACGFADQSHFTRVFKQEVGLSPAAWRRNHVFETALRARSAVPAPVTGKAPLARTPVRPPTCRGLSPSLTQPA